ncbi:Lon protease family protein [Ruminiclostridium cellulolyticum]|uniref:endopeptidase La n=1 Tax=Ruminiclostridium cellulolyticum (strain ATCC 35319 / DSM 5812 / JCM 6584 / H10) TaxID=394503 RepID=B8I823_RUMCH|nr:ATP-binding protein [Ruminiclostridium cellulolyticum]ACL75180.1 peptidase S16, lon-like protein [Ruminiclostridium cellulolyticum H10]
MPKLKELSYQDIDNRCKLESLPFKNTSQLDTYEGIIGQERASKAMEFGLKMKMRGYNIYMSGPTGTGKTSFARQILNDTAANQKIPDDWCYIYNFSQPNQPLAINLPVGTGKQFQQDMDEFTRIIKQEIANAFDNDQYEKEKSEIMDEYEGRKGELLDKLSKDAEEHGFKVNTGSSGIYFLPIIEGRTISEEEFISLDEETKDKINEKTNILQQETLDIIRKLKNNDKETEKKVSEWENRIALLALGVHIDDLKEKYKKFDVIQKYLEEVQQDILDNLDDFKEEEVSEEQQQLIIPWMQKPETSISKYKVNVLVDNSGLTGAPVIFDFNPTYSNLIGKIEYENEFGSVSTDYTKIKPGLFHIANGGYLVLQAKDVLSNPQAYEAINRVLKTKKIIIENMKDQTGVVAVTAIKPQPIPVDLKVILVGSTSIYELLYEYEEDFRKLFKVKVDFDEVMERNDENILKLAKFISGFCKKENTLHFDKTGVAKVVEYASWLVEDKNKLSTRFNEIVEILCEACMWAEDDGAKLVKAKHVQQAISEKAYRCDRLDKRLLEMLNEGTIMVDTEGSEIGQINGLTVMDMGDYSFGKPSRITASTYIGESGIVNVEREVDLSGTSHSKGVLILSGYIGQKYAQEFPLSLTASLCFEQMYGGVDGDSASSAELYAILSSLAEVPIKQSIAVTGSVNQKGEIQPVGGVAYKIEGFFELCKLRGLTGEHGVIIPIQNVKNLVLRDEVIDAVKKKLFHIYPVTTIDQGIEILTGKKAGEKATSGEYKSGTINYLVNEKLRRFAATVSYGGKRKI